MREEKVGRYRRITIGAGEYYVADDPVMISTLLGSCVSCCLYDPVNQVVGMNHFMLSNPRYSRDIPTYESEAGRYGIQAMELLVNGMMAKGADRRYLRAKAFGGASLVRNGVRFDNFFCVGEVNCRFIRDFLCNDGIPLDAEDLGGESGRVIHFSNGDFSVYCRKIDPAKSRSLAIRDHDCWAKAIEMQEQAMPVVELWG